MRLGEVRGAGREWVGGGGGGGGGGGRARFRSDRILNTETVPRIKIKGGLFTDAYRHCAGVHGTSSVETNRMLGTGRRLGR